MTSDRGAAAGARGRRGRGADRRAARYAVRAVVAVLALAGLTVGGSAIATPPGGRSGLPEAASTTHSSYAAPSPYAALAPYEAPSPYEALAPYETLLAHPALSPYTALAPYEAPASQTLRAPALARAPRNAAATRAAVVRLVNRERAKAGCRPVRAHRTVTKAAQRHSDHMAREGSLSHRERGGSGPGSRLSAVGYDWRRAGENIARGQRGAAEVVRAWARSPEHQVVLADCAFRHAGVGINSGTDDRGPWWTLLLARPL
ncbi:CAP domain-containing protein [Streptomyces sp. NPDC045369]|uniref:CAP domain-containing protein n=1 Tax=Streptomyces sp. NPDC045369 TaxID=3155732 RepID=UPI0034073148